MKYEVRVGQEFSCYLSEEQPERITINLTQTLAAAESAAPESPKAKQKSRLSLAIIVVVGLIGFAVIPATVYGAVSGDYTVLRSVAEVTRDLAKAGLSLIRPSS